MTKIEDAITVLQILSGKTLTNTQMLSIVNKYNASFGNRFSNPWNEDDNPDEYAAWPTNEEKATFLLQNMRGEIRSRLEREGRKSEQAAQDAVISAAGQTAADEL